LGENDIYKTEATEAGFDITITRGMDITVDVCGKAVELLSYGETVGELLERNSITLKDTCSTSVELDAQVNDGMIIVITDTVVTEEAYTVTIPYETIYQDTDNLEAGKEVVLTAGADGEKSCTAQVTYTNGTESDREVLSEKVTVEPVNRVIARGTGNGKGSGSRRPIIGDGVIITPEGDVLTYTHVDTYKATSYCRTDVGGETTSTGTKTRVGVVAVDPRLIPYGTRMYIVTKDGHYIYGVCTAEDCGGDIKNKRLDLFYETHGEAIAFGVRDCYVYFLG
jgi:3D (Asp-Asp-Asp) domain-containing protein